MLSFNTVVPKLLKFSHKEAQTILEGVTQKPYTSTCLNKMEIKVKNFSKNPANKPNARFINNQQTQSSFTSLSVKEGQAGDPNSSELSALVTGSGLFAVFAAYREARLSW